MKSFTEFWPFYLGEHQNTINRSLHLFGTAMVIGLLSYSIYTGRWNFLVILPLIGYGFAWIGHFVFEKNKPATFRYPLWSFLADFKMFGHFITGTLQKEINSSKPNKKH